MCEARSNWKKNLRNPILLNGTHPQKDKLFGIFITCQRHTVFREKGQNI